MFIEILEPRIAPAGVVEVFYTPKSLIVKDSVGDDSTLTITADPSGAITITPDPDTRLNLDGSELMQGAPVTLPVFVGSVNVALGGGADNLTMTGEFPRGVKVDLGGGENFLTFEAASVLGAVQVRGGAQGDFLNFKGANIFANSFTANLGNGLNLAGQGSGETTLTVGKNFTLLGGTGEGNGFLLSLFDIHIGGNALFGGSGAINQFGLTAFGVLSIGGSVSMTSVAPQDGESDFILNATDELFIGGNVTMKSNDTDKVVLGINSTGSLHIGGSVKINTGKLAGVNAVQLAAEETLFIGKSVTMTTSKDMRPFISGTSVAGPSFIGGAVTVKGSRTATLALDGTVAGAVNITVDGEHGTPVSVSSATPEGRLRLLSAVTISTFGTSTGTTTLVDNVFAFSSVTIKDGAGGRNISVQDSLVIGALNIDSGAGVDTVRLEGTGDPGSLFLFGPLSIKTGAGLDVILVGGNDPGTGVTATLGKIFVDGGPDLADYSVGMASLLQGVPVLKNITVM